MLGFKILMASAILTLMLTGGMAFAKSMLDTHSNSESNSMLDTHSNSESNPDSKSSDCKSDCENDTVTTNSGVEPDNDSENNNVTSNSGIESVTLKAQLKKDSLLTGWYDIKKFRMALSDGNQICPSNNCEYTVQNGKIFSLGDSSYSIDGKLKVTVPRDGSSKSVLYPLGLTLDQIGEEESHGQKTQTFSGTFEVGPHITYHVTNATLEIGKSPVLTIAGEKGQQNSTDLE